MASEKYDDPYKSASSRSEEKPELDEVRIKEGEKGGHVVTHHFTSSGMGYKQPEVHPFSKGDGDKLIEHLKKHLHIKATNDENEKEPPSASAEDKKTKGAKGAPGKSVKEEKGED